MRWVRHAILAFECETKGLRVALDASLKDQKWLRTKRPGFDHNKCYYLCSRVLRGILCSALGQLPLLHFVYGSRYQQLGFHPWPSKIPLLWMAHYLKAQMDNRQPRMPLIEVNRAANIPLPLYKG